MSTLETDPSQTFVPRRDPRGDENRHDVLPGSQHAETTEDRVLVWHPVSARTLRRLPNQHNLTEVDDDEHFAYPRSGDETWSDIVDADASDHPSADRSAPGA